MSSAKEDILQRIREAHKLSNPAVIQEPVRNYIRKAALPAGDPALIKDFIEKLEDYTAVVVCCKEHEIADKISDFLDDRQSVVVPSGLPEAWKEGVRRNGRKVYEDSREERLSNQELDAIEAVVTASRTGVSLSGTIILDGEPDQGRRAITLIPDTHVVVVYANTVYGSVPEAVEILSQNPTRPMTWIAGPSATSDIELIRVDGVHGPRNLRVVIVTE